MKDEETEYYTDFSYRHQFSEEDLYLLIDSILFSRQIKNKDHEIIIKKLESLSSKYFNSRMNRIRAMSRPELVNDDLFNNIKKLDQVMRESKKVSFKYNEYIINERSELELRPRVERDGKERIYIINPYEMVATNGRYYLICNYDSYSNLSNYRIDRITNIKVILLSESRKPIDKLKGVSSRFNLSDYMDEHIYMFQGKVERVKLRLKKQAMTDFIDWFGTEGIHFSKQTRDEVTVRVKVNREAMRKWAMQYGQYVTVLSLSQLVKDIKGDLAEIVRHYEESNFEND